MAAKRREYLGLRDNPRRRSSGSGSGISSAGIGAETPKRNELDPDQMDRLDYFVAALKRHGVYADINLHVSREYWEGEDFPDGLNSRQRREQMPHYGHGVDKINDQMIRMQRQYARMLLTHVNRYTKTPNHPLVRHDVADVTAVRS